MGLYVVGIDGGGSRTVGVLLDEKGQPVARAVGGPSNYHTSGLEQAGTNLFDVIERLIAEAETPLDTVARFCFALAGVWRETGRRAVSGILDRHGVLGRSTLVSDAEAVLAGVEAGARAVVVIAGTGSIVLGRDELGNVSKVGGNGHLLDDDGSGYDIGRAGLRAVLEASDGRGPQTRLTDAVLAAAGLSGVDGIVPWLYGESAHKPAVAALAPAVIETAAKGDGPAMAVLERAAGELARWAGVAARAVQPGGEKITVLLAGGVLERSDLYRRLVTERITRELPDAHVGVPEHEAAYGAARIALRYGEFQDGA